MLRIAAVALVLLIFASSANGQSRIALLIGNESYVSKVGPLKNPHNDIRVIGAALRTLGFKVTEIRDADYRSLDSALKRHVTTVRREGQGVISFVYYSGHGAADPDTKINYLIPVDVANADDEDLWTYSLNLNTVVESLRAQAPGATHYIVFDACRNELNLVRRGQKALTDKGFVPMAYTPGVMVAYATAPGKTASDRGSGGGAYAKTLAEEIIKPGVEAMTMFRRVALRVNGAIGQDPWMSASTLPEVYLAGRENSVGTPTPAPAISRSSEAAEAWDRTKDSASVAALEAFIRRFGDTYYGDLAKVRLAELKKVESKEAEAARQATRAARQKADEEARAKAELERQRVALLKKEEGERKRTEDAGRNKTEAAVNLREPTAKPVAPEQKGWVLLGQQSAGYAVDVDEVNISAGRLQHLYLVVEQNDVHLMSANFLYLNGSSEDFRIDKLIRQGNMLPIQLKGDKQHLARIEMTYRSRPRSDSVEGVVKVYGEPARGQ